MSVFMSKGFEGLSHFGLVRCLIINVCCFSMIQGLIVCEFFQWPWLGKMLHYISFHLGNIHLE